MSDQKEDVSYEERNIFISALWYIAEMPTSGDLRSGDTPVSNYPNPPLKKKEMRPPLNRPKSN